MFDFYKCCNYNDYNKIGVRVMKISSWFIVVVYILFLIKVDSSYFSILEWIVSSVNINFVVIRWVIGMLKKVGFVGVKVGVGGVYLLKDLEEIMLLDVYWVVVVVEEGELF